MKKRSERTRPDVGRAKRSSRFWGAKLFITDKPPRLVTGSRPHKTYIVISVYPGIKYEDAIDFGATSRYIREGLQEGLYRAISPEGAELK